MRRTLFLAAAGLVAGTTTLAAQAAAPALKWGPAPAVFPAGAQMAVVSGDPTKAGPFVIELSMPSGYRIPPHTHPTDESVKVVKGTFLVGMGDTFDEGRTKPMGVGATGSIKAGMAHFAAAQGATVVSVTSTGPFAMTYVNPSDDPTKALAKPKS
jgi:quercetin dioxygenase-like cupin family protein